MTGIEAMELPPHDYGLESMALSLITMDLTRASLFDINCFYVSEHKKIYKALCEVKSPDTLIIATKAKLNEDLVIDAITRFVSSDNLDYVVTELWKYRSARAVDLWADLLKRHARALEIDKAQMLLAKITTALTSAATQEKTKDEQALEYFEDINKVKKIIQTGYKVMDDVLSLTGGQLVVIAGRPSMGKTTFMLNIALRQASKHKVGFASLEMSTFEIYDRMVCMIGNLNSDQIKNKLLNVDNIREQVSTIMEKDIVITDDIYTLSKIEAFIAKNQLDICYVDYLGLIQHGDSRMNIVAKLTEITMYLKAIAKRYNCHIVIGAQLSRGVEGRPDKRPVLSDLRDSGSIEQDADIVLMLHREEYYDHTTENKNKIDVLIRKNRNGPREEVVLDTKFDSYRIMDIT